MGTPCPPAKFALPAVQVSVLVPIFWPEDSPAYLLWKQSCEAAEKYYFSLLESGATPQQARSILPNSLKTEIVMTANLREWHHVLQLRTAKSAHPQMQQVMKPLLCELKTHLGAIFDDINP